MRYVFSVPGAERRVMHIQRHDRLGNALDESLCGLHGPFGARQVFNRSINAPWGLGRPVCKQCRKAASSEPTG